MLTSITVALACVVVLGSIGLVQSAVDCGCSDYTADRLIYLLGKRSSSIRLTNISSETLLNSDTNLVNLQNLIQVAVFDEYAVNVTVTIFSVQNVDNSAVDVIVGISSDADYWPSAVVTVILQSQQLEINAWAAGFGASVHSMPVDQCKYKNSVSTKDCHTTLNTTNIANGDKTFTTNVGVFANVAFTTQSSSCVKVAPQPSQCTDYVCLNGGSCSNLIGSNDQPAFAECHCPANYDGQNCELTKIRFSQGGYAAFSGLGFCESTHLSFYVRTNLTDAALLYNGPVTSKPESVFAIYLKDDRLVVAGTLKSSAYEFFIVPNSSLSDNSWHRIDVAVLTDLSLAITVDRTGINASIYSEFNLAAMNSIDLSVQPLLLGSSTEIIPGFPRVFSGDLRLVRINGLLTDLDNDQIFWKGTSTDFCNCGVNEICNEFLKCVCKHGYTEIENECSTKSEVWKFSNNSTVEWSLKLNGDVLIKTLNSISFQFRNRATDADLLWAETIIDSINSFLSFYIQNGELLLWYNFGRNQTHSFGKVNYDSGWHNVSFSTFYRSVEVITDNSFTSPYYYSSELPGETTQQVLFGNLRAGGNLLSSNPTYGNMADFRVLSMLPANSDPLSLTLAANSDYPRVTVKASVEQVSVDASSYDFCSANAQCSKQKCFNVWPTSTCGCYPETNYTLNNEKMCVVDNGCVANPTGTCQNNGTCNLNATAVFTCQCQSNYYGVYCQNALNSTTDLSSSHITSPAVIVAESLKTEEIILIIVLSVVGFVILLLLILLLIFWCKQKKQKEAAKDTSQTVYVEREQQVDDGNDEGCPPKDNTSFDLNLLKEAVQNPAYEPAIEAQKSTQVHVANRSVANSAVPAPRSNGGVQNAAFDAEDSVKNFSSSIEIPKSAEDDQVTLSSVASGNSTDESQDFEYLESWGPKFQNIANLYSSADPGNQDRSSDHMDI